MKDLRLIFIEWNKITYKFYNICYFISNMSATKINLLLGDIIEIIAPSNDTIHKEIFLITVSKLPKRKLSLLLVKDHISVIYMISGVEILFLQMTILQFIKEIIKYLLAVRGNFI